MAISLVGKIVIACLTVAVLGGLIATIVILVQDDSETTTETPGTTTTTGGVTDPGPEEDAPYRVGVGIADMTGPCTDITFMGYAELGQTGNGIHLRQFSRAFIFVKDNTRVVLVTAESQAIGIAVRREVVKNLQALYGDVYNLRNVIITGTHTHSAPGGFLVNFLLDISILGFSRETFDAYVAGITRSIVRAHENIVPARLYFGETRVNNAHMNRSPYSYEYNPPEERARYGMDTDNTLTQLRVVKTDGSLHGVLNWFAVHTTSMNMTNGLISSDNLGYAAVLLERTLNPNSQVGKGPVVAGFFSANLGDVSPNIRGARCEFSGDQCDNQFLLCSLFERCFSLGPGDDMFESTRIIGTAVYEGALEVLSSPGEELTGQLAVVHQFINMSEEIVPRYDPVDRTFDLNDTVQGCVAALGYSFASGTIDGANVLNITQGTIVGNPLMDALGGIVAAPTEEDRECHAPKPILLGTGRANFPVPWHPSVVSASVIWLAGLAIAAVPGEPTTMAGRRIKDVLREAMVSAGHEPRVAVSGLANEYIHYVSTYEEYQVQRYEAASTIYGPHTLNIFLYKFQEFINVAIEGGDVDPGIEPEDHLNNTVSLILPVVFDSPSLNTQFGEVIEAPPSSVRRGEVVSATFVAASPRNDLKQESTHAQVERFELGEWKVVATDADLETKFYWNRRSTLIGSSEATFEWLVPSDAIVAPHRIVYFGASKNILGVITEFTGQTEAFEIQS